MNSIIGQTYVWKYWILPNQCYYDELHYRSDLCPKVSEEECGQYVLRDCPFFQERRLNVFRNLKRLRFVNITTEFPQEPSALMWIEWASNLLGLSNFFYTTMGLIASKCTCFAEQPFWTIFDPLWFPMLCLFTLLKFYFE